MHHKYLNRARYIKNLLISFFIVLFLIIPSNASELKIDETIVISGDPSVFYINGRITKDTWTRFVIAVTSRKIKTVDLNSFGGFVSYAKSIATFIKLRKIDTRVSKYSGCFSACVMIFQAGKNRIAHANAVFMLHPVSVKRAGDTKYTKNKKATNDFFAWLVENGLKKSALPRLKKDRAIYFTAEFAKFFGVATKIVGKTVEK